MFIYRGILALVAMAVGAALVLALPGFSPEAEAVTHVPVVKSDRLDYQPHGGDCSKQAWPYYETGCLRDRNQPVAGEARSVRVIITDRIASK